MERAKETLAPKENEYRIRFGQLTIEQNGGIRIKNKERQEKSQKNTHHPALEAEEKEKKEGANAKEQHPTGP